jgi:putative transcriptional regulator
MLYPTAMIPYPTCYHMDMTSLQGKLLLATPAMEDPNFARSVVLVVKHDGDGAMGLVLNRPTGAAVREAIDEDGDVACQTDAGLFRGGPCEGPLMVLHDQAELSQQSVLAGVYFTVESNLVRELLMNDQAQARYFHGYAGWDAGQLDAELAAGGWLTLEATAENVFQTGMDTQSWAALLRERGLEELKGRINPNLIPPDPTVN